MRSACGRVGLAATVSFTMISAAACADGGVLTEPDVSTGPSTLEPVVEAGGGSSSELVREFEQIAGLDGVAGFSYAVVGPDGVIGSGGSGFADRDADIDVTSDTLFHVGSMHKAMNALMVATLVDDGTLTWDTALADIVGDDVPSDITIRHLLNMTSGLPEDAEDGVSIGLDDSALVDDEIMGALEDFEPLGDAGTVFEYSNVSASAAGYAAVIADDPDIIDVYEGYLDLFTERVLDPLGMVDSYLVGSDASATGLLSRAYGLDDGEVVELPSGDRDLDALAPSGLLKSSANDMAKFLSVLLADGVGPNGEVVVSPGSIDEMWLPVLDGYAMGWEDASVDGVGYLAHEGSFDGFAGTMVVVPELDVAMVLLTNSEDAADRLVTRAPALLIADLLDT